MGVGAVLAVGCVTGCGGPTYVDPASESATGARRQALERIDARLAEIRAAATYLTPLSEVTRDECIKGQHNWKVDDPYDSWCGLRTVAAFGFDGDFVTRLQQLDATLRELGWRGEGLREALDYWRECSDNSCLNFPDYGPANLPQAWYDDSEGNQIAIGFAAADTPRDDLTTLDGFSRQSLRGVCDVSAYHCTVRGTAWGKVWRTAREDHEFLLLITVPQAYSSTGN